MDVGPTETKKQLLEHLLQQGMVLVALDARTDGVSIPPHLSQDAQLRLNLSYRFGLPMEVSDWGVDATLTFSGRQCSCQIPWRAIFLMVSHATGQPYLFPEDVPQELVEQAEAHLQGGDAAGDVAEAAPDGTATAAAETGLPRLEPAQLLSPGAAPPRRPQLRLVSEAVESQKVTNAKADLNPSGKSTPASPASSSHRDDGPPEREPPRPRRGHLRLVK